MTRIGLLSDTHGTLPDKTFAFFDKCQQIWHAGDIGNVEIVERLESFRPLVAVYGNVDGAPLRVMFRENVVFRVEDVKVVMIHIGGYPGKYSKKAAEIIRHEKPALFVSGHSHILKVMYDEKFDLLHINPGAAGKYGLHQKITLVRFAIDGHQIKDLEVFEQTR
jgi:putative phosphoesterase